MKYQGNIAQVKAIQDEIQKTKFSFTDRVTGWRGEPGIEPSSLYQVRLTLQDTSSKFLNGYLFYISFKYMQREDKAELWIKDEDTGRLFKVFPQVVPLWGALTAIKLPEKEAQVTRESYRMNHEMRRAES